MARYQLTLAYDGSDFFGSQRQAKRRTVQGELEKALHRLGWTGRSVLMAGRTDTGVHARGQVAAFDLAWSHSEEKMLRALNASLPGDLSVQRVRQVHDSFHPRFDAVSRRYRYVLFCQPVRDPLRERFAWRIQKSLRGSILDEIASLFPGTHDFSALGSPTTPGGGTTRTITRAEWSQVLHDEWRFDVEADAFLYRMVRKLVFLQVAVAQGRLSLERVADALANPQGGALPAGLAPAHGLTLVEVAYPDNESMDQSEMSAVHHRP